MTLKEIARFCLPKRELEEIARDVKAFREGQRSGISCVLAAWEEKGIAPTKQDLKNALAMMGDEPGAPTPDGGTLCMCDRCK